MSITESQFTLLRAIDRTPGMDAPSLFAQAGLTPADAESVLAYLAQSGLVDLATMQITEQGLHELRPYKVDNAVVLAAGFASRCAPLSYERPKGLFKVRGEILIERQIRQLKEAGIDEIYVVVGYMKELFFYLEDKFDVKIVVNDDYYRRNNTSSLYAARYFLRNSYVCSSDNYFAINPFEKYVYQSYFACAYSKGKTDEWIARENDEGRIVEYGVGGSDAWYQVGEFYWAKDFSRTFMDLLEAEYDDPEVIDMLLDAFFARHIDVLDARIKRYGDNEILEFDTVDEIKRFDSHFVENMDSCIIENICSTLDCSEDEVGGFEQIKRGNTNVIFTFECRGVVYVYRHPGKGSDKIIDRRHEEFAQMKADELGIDGTTVAMDAEGGWKISRYVDDCYLFEYHNDDDAARAFDLMRRLHAAKIDCGWDFDLLANCARFQRLADDAGFRSSFELKDLSQLIQRLARFVEADGVEKVMCHNDVCDSNIVPSRLSMRIIDWEYAGMADPASDVCSYLVGGEHTEDEIDHLLEVYFMRPPSDRERRHMYGMIALVGYHWLCWGIYRLSIGHDAGSLLYYWYRYAMTYGEKAIGMYAPDEVIAIP